MTQSFVRFEKLKKNFGAVPILHGIDLGIEEGEFVVLVGPSGCGKSTLLRILAGLETLTSGDIFIGNRRVNNVHAKDRGISMVFQSYALYPHMTVDENMSFGLRMRKTPPKVTESRISNAAKILQLSPLLDRLPTQLSGGQRQRVAMGRAIVREPEVFLFDEPLSNLDAKLRVEMRSEIRALHQRLSATTIYVTHDQIEAMTMADKVVVMHAGRIEQVGRPMDIYDTPANLFVAEFLGSPAMNLIAGEIAASDGGMVFTYKDNLTLRLPPLANVSPRQRLTIGIRPEHVKIGAGDTTGTATLVEPGGFETHVHVSVGEKVIRVLSTDRPQVRVNDVVNLSFDASKLHMFDTKTGERL